jgi:hypothetical protein
MKTEEDEAFDDLAKRQGAWGGGFPAKRKMAADKFIAAEERKVGERYGYVPKLHPSEWMNAQPAQEPVKCLDCGSNNVGFPATYDSLVNSVKAQPAQKPVGTLNINRYKGHLVNHDFDYFGELPDGIYSVYTTPPQRPWVGLTDEDRKAALLTAYKEWECEEFLLCAREDYLLIEQALQEKNT